MMTTSLKKYQFNGIEDWGGVISDDFKAFARAYKSMLNKMCKDNGWELVKFSVGHYYCSWFIKNGEKFIYCSFSDVRHFAREWYKNILYRSAKSDSDYTGGSNWYSDIESLDCHLQKHFLRMS